MSSRERIVPDIARCLYYNDWAIYEENGSNHICAACFQQIQKSTDEQTIDFIISCIEIMKNNAIIGFSEGTDRAVIRFSTVVGYKLGIPSFPVIIGNENGGPLPTSPANSSLSCSLLLSYISNVKQLYEVLYETNKLGHNITQVIVMVDEDGQGELVCRERRIDFKRLTTLSEILEHLHKMDASFDRIRIQRILELFSRK